MSPQISYFFKKIYGNIIKWWFVIYNPIARRIWPTKEEEEEALAKEEEEEKEEKEIEREEREELTKPAETIEDEKPDSCPEPIKPTIDINDANYNATTGSFSGLYGQAPIDSNTQSKFDEIMGRNNAAHSVDISAIAVNNEPVSVASDQDEVLAQANEIYERLMREAAADEAAKQAEIEAAKAAQQ